MMSDRRIHLSHYFAGVHDKLDPSNATLGWRWHCSCGAKGRIQNWDRETCAYGWYAHFFRAVGVTIPRDRRFQPWMYRNTKERFGERAADVQRIYLADEYPHPLGPNYYPTVGHYPWTRGKPRPDDLFKVDVS